MNQINMVSAQYSYKIACENKKIRYQLNCTVSRILPDMIKEIEREKMGHRVMVIQMQIYENLKSFFSFFFLFLYVYMMVGS